MPNKRKICAEHNNLSQSIFIPTLNSWYPIENVINSAYRKVLDFKENAEKILEKEKLETLSLNDFSKAILDSRSFNISLQHYCIVLKCYITLEKDKDVKKKRSDQTPPITPLNEKPGHLRMNSISSDLYDEATTTTQSSYGSSPSGLQGLINNSSSNTQISSGGAKKVNVEVIMRSNPFRVEENEKTTRMELIRNNSDNGMLRFTYYVKPEFEARKINRDTNAEMFENGKLIVFTNDFFTVYQEKTGEMEISLNEIVQSAEEQKRTEALGEKLCILLKDRPRHRALLTNECKLNTHNSLMSSTYSPESINTNTVQFSETNQSSSQTSSNSSQEDETFYTRELINIYGQPIVPSFHKYFNYQLSNTHYGYRTLRRLLNCDILKKYVKITKEEIRSLDRVVEFVQLTTDKCLTAFQLNLTTFYDSIRFENGIVKNSLDLWYVSCLKEMYMNDTNVNKDLLYSTLTSSSSPTSSTTTTTTTTSTTSTNNNSQTKPNKDTTCFLQTSHYDTNQRIECDESNHLWFCLQDYGCRSMDEFLMNLNDYISFKTNRSELILIQTIHPVFEYKNILSESRRILSICLNKSITNIGIDEIVNQNIPKIARHHVESLLSKYINFDHNKRISGFTALFEILMILKRELSKEKNDEMKYSHFLCTLERNNSDKLKLAITQLKCVPCLNKFTTNYSLTNSQSQIFNNNNSSQMVSIPQYAQQQQQQQQNKSNQLFLVSNPTKLNITQTNMTRLIKQMSLIVSTELQQIAIDLIEKQEDEKIVKYIRLKDEFKQQSQQQQQHISQSQSTPSSLASVCSSSNNNNSTYSSRTPNIPSLHKTTSFISRNLNTELASILPSPSIPTNLTTIDTNAFLKAATLLNTQCSSSSSNSTPIQPITKPITTELNKPIQKPRLQLFNPNITLTNLQQITDKFSDMSTSALTDGVTSNMYLAANNRY